MRLYESFLNVVKSESSRTASGFGSLCKENCPGAEFAEDSPDIWRIARGRRLTHDHDYGII